MDIDACYRLGHIRSTHGLKGEVHIKLDVDQPERYSQLKVFYLERESALIPFFLQHITMKGNKTLVKFEDIDSLEEARPLIGAALYLPLEDLPPLEGGDSYYYHELIQSQVVDVNQGALGSITHIYDQTPQPILGMNYRQREVLIPHNKDIILGWDRDQKTLKVALPEGLLNIYLEED